VELQMNVDGSTKHYFNETIIIIIINFFIKILSKAAL